MKSYLYHLQLNIDFANLPFYKDFMTFLGWSSLFEDTEVVGYTSGKDGALWFIKSESKETSDYDNKGVNHISLRVEKQSDIDELKTALEKKGIKMLFDTPRHRPEFAQSENETYYQIMFETPDNILFEIVYIGPKQ